MVGSDCSETSSYEGTLDSQEFEGTPDSDDFESTPDFDDYDHVDYWDTIDGMPPGDFLSQHGFMISIDNCVGIIPCTETLSRFKPYLTGEEHYDVLLETCDELGHTFYIEPVYETMYTDDVVCYLEEYLPNFDDYPSLHWIAPSARLNSLVDVGSVYDLRGWDLAENFCQATYAFVTVHDKGDENATPKHDLLKPNNRFMAAFVRNYRKAGFDIPDSALSPAILRMLSESSEASDDEDADDDDIEPRSVATGDDTGEHSQAGSCVPEATGDSMPCAASSPPPGPSEPSQVVPTEAATTKRDASIVTGPATSRPPSPIINLPSASVDDTSTATSEGLQPHPATVKRKASAELSDGAKKVKV